MEGDLHVPASLGGGRGDTEQLLAQPLQVRDDVEIVGIDAEPQAAGMQGAVPHEVADELGEVGCHRGRHPDVPFAGPAHLVGQRRQHDLVRRSDECAERQRHSVASTQIGEPSPHPGASLVDHLDTVLRRALDAVSAARRDVDDLFQAIHIELRGLTLTVVGVHAERHVLPLCSVGVA